MKILNYGSGSIKNNIIREQNFTSRNNVDNKNLSSDVFQKSRISFGGSILGSIFKFLSDLRHEGEVEGYISALSGKNFQNLLKMRKNDKIDVFNNTFFGDIESFDTDFVNNLFINSGIRNIYGLDLFLKNFSRNSQNKRIFSSQMIEAVKIYGYLNEKNDINNYGEMLLYIFNQESDSDNPDYDKLNKTIKFLQNIGLKSFKDFDKKFEHLKDKFNNFADIGDKIDAIDYIMQTYRPKIDFIEGIINQKGLKNLNAAKIYANINHIVDYLYEKNNGESLSPLEDILETISQRNKIKSYAYNTAALLCNEFKNPDDEMEFYSLLTECSVSIDDFNEIAKKSIISDNDVLENIVAYDSVSREISFNEGINIRQSRDLYKKFSDLFNAVYKTDEGINEIKTLLEVIHRFEIKNTSSMLDFYNNANGTKVKSISSEEFLKFIDLFKYSDSDNLLKEAKLKKTTAVDILLAEKSQFERVEPIISDFIINDKTAYFAGKGTLEIYKEYKDLINKNPDNTLQILQNIINLKVNDSDEYKHKSEEVNKFAQYFEDNKLLALFLANNKVNFDDEEESKIYREQCLSILRLIKCQNNPEKSSEIIKYISQTGFITKSKSVLTEFINSQAEQTDKNEILLISADKHIVSLTSLVNFIRNYKSEDGHYENIIQHLKSQPANIDFTAYKKVLSNIQNKIDSLNIPLKINNDNILNVDISRFSPDTDDKEFYQMLNKIFNAAQRQNFITKIPGILRQNTQQHFSKYRIASEIVSKIDKTDESYSNIASLFKIDRKSLGLENDCADSIYIKKVEEVLPKEFIDFINSNDWLLYDKQSNKIPNLSLHARMRIIDRFAIADIQDINELYSDKTKKKLHQLFKSAFSDLPSCVKGPKDGNVFITNFDYNSNVIEAVFSQDGTMVTIVPKSRNRN